MREEGIVAAWMSPFRVRRFGVCNLAFNVTMQLVANLVASVENCELSKCLFSYMFHGYGFILFVMGITLVVLGFLGKVENFPRGRVLGLVVTGLMDAVWAGIFLSV